MKRNSRCRFIAAGYWNHDSLNKAKLMMPYCWQDVSFCIRNGQRRHNWSTTYSSGRQVLVPRLYVMKHWSPDCMSWNTGPQTVVNHWSRTLCCKTLIPKLYDVKHWSPDVLTTQHPSIHKRVGTNFADKLWSLGRYSSLADSDRGNSFSFLFWSLQVHFVFPLQQARHFRARVYCTRNRCLTRPDAFCCDPTISEQPGHC
jgi:hypothetical protein